MRKKYQCQVMLDMVMVSILLSLMGFHLWSEYVHEWLGAVFFLMVILHVSWNIHWIKALFQVEYSTFRILQLSINVLLMLLFLSAAISGMMLSRHILPNFIMHNSSDLVRKIHMTSVHWGLVVIALHLGVHWKMLANFFCKIWHISPDSVLVRRILPALLGMVSGYGLYAFIHRGILPYLLLQVDFAFFDFEESKLLVYWDFFAIMMFGAYLTRYLIWLTIFRPQ